MKESQICAPCHNASFWNVPIYQSYSEWLASPYAEDGITCQDCHMTPDGLTTNFAPSRGGVDRDPESVPTHNFPGAVDSVLLQNSVSLDASVSVHDDQLDVTVNILNDKTGHHIPSDSPLRQMILLVRVSDNNGNELPLLEGPVLPDWCGLGNPEEGYYAGLPGTAYAKVLEELWTGISPGAAYWTPTRILSDNRIPAKQNDKTTYTFADISGGDVTIEIELIYRRSFIDLRDIKGWELADIIIASEVIQFER